MSLPEVQALSVDEFNLMLGYLVVRGEDRAKAIEAAKAGSERPGMKSVVKFSRPKR
jgi:hypothetical protein